MGIWFWILVYVLLMPTFYLGIKMFHVKMSRNETWTIGDRTIAIIVCFIPPITIVMIGLAVIFALIIGFVLIVNVVEDLFKGRNFWNKSAKW